jgi:ferric-dicitrate binding protein FerR (iron transport regulator)
LKRLLIRSACCISLFLSAPAIAAKTAHPAATVILLEGEPTYFEHGHRHVLDLGQALGKEAEIQTPKDGSIHLVLVNGSSLILAADSHLKLEALDLPPARPRYRAKLTQGRLAVMVDPKDQALNLDLSTNDAAVSFKRGHFELAVTEGGSEVTVDQGSVDFGDVDHKRTETVGALRSCSLFNGRLEHANRLSKREAGDFRQRWQRGEMVHQQRAELIKHFKGVN